MNPLLTTRFWEDPSFVGLNRLPMRATCYPFANQHQAQALNREDSPWFELLNGSWDFHCFSSPEKALESLHASSLPFVPIQVPGNWQLQGHGRPHYTNVQMPFPHEPPTVPTENPTGLYRRRFQLPTDWKQRRTVIHFGGATSVLLVWLNGNFVGLSKDSCLPAEFDLTPFLRAGENELSALVIQWSDATFVEDQDQWWLAGLYREVYLYSTPQVWIQDVQIRADWDSTRRVAHLEVAAPLGYTGQPDELGSVELDVWDAAGRSLLRQPAVSDISKRGGHLANPRLSAAFQLELKNVRPWSAEQPELYRVVLTLRHPRGEDFTVVRTGFRRIEIRGKNLLINGARVAIRGVNRHDHHDTKGKAVDRETMRLDAMTMKRFNFNAVRTSHYPNDPAWLDFCDELGLYVIDEANIEAHAFHNYLCRDPRYRTAWVERAGRMVQRDRNHPAIFLWSLGNESGYGPNHDAAAGAIRQLDPTRPLHYEGAISVGQSQLPLTHRSPATDVVCPMYTHPNDIRAWAKARDDRPFILCEYSHAMGNSNGGLADYFELFENCPGVQGGFIWEWLDHGLKQTSADGRNYWAYGGDFGDKPNDANFVCDGLVWPDRQPHPGIYEFKKLAQPVRLSLRPDGRLAITNKNFFRSLDWLKGEWDLLVDGVIVAQGQLPALKAAPQTTVVVAWKKPAKKFAGREMSLLVRLVTRQAEPWCEAGHLVAWEQLRLPNTGLLKPVHITPAPPLVEIDETSSKTISARAGDLVLTFEATHGLTEICYGGRPVLNAAPLLNVWRAPTDNDGIKLWTSQHDKPLGRWQALGLPQVTSTLLKSSLTNSRSQGPAWTYHFQATGRGQPKDFLWHYRVSLPAPNVLRLSAAFQVHPSVQDLPRLGLLFSLAPGWEDLRWLGLGPLENYPDRLKAAWRAEHHSTVTDQYVPYIMPQENGLKCETDWVALDRDAHQLKIESRRPIAFSASHFRPEDLTAAHHTIDLQPRAETILCLDAAHRGLGTASCGPDVFDAYKIRGSRFALDLEWIFSDKTS